MAKKILPAAIPHIRAMDIPPGDEIPLGQTLLEAGLNEVLVIRGDSPQDLSRHTYPNESEDIVRRFKKHHPDMKVFAAFDPYRQSIRDEMKTVARKIDAGVDGFFTQPIFDLRILEISAELLQGQDVFWGIAPVVGERSRAYWETANKIVFPKGFCSTLTWNREFAQTALPIIKSLRGNVYFMPIRVDLSAYLTGLF